jgi:hypothetical protein
MIVSINQPAYLPWMGYFHRIAASDAHIVLDHAQFEKNSFVNRNRVRTAEGSTWLTVPVKTSGKFGDLPICELEIDNTRDWRRKHWSTLQQCYGRAPFFGEHENFFSSVLAQTWTHLAPLCNEITQYLLAAFGISTPLQYSSHMSPEGKKDALVLDLCRKAGATVYYSGVLGRQYIREELFQEHGIAVAYQEYKHPAYKQSHAGTFVPFMAAIDLLLNVGPRSLEVLMTGQERVGHGARSALI